jgi:hypothetical protein
MIRIVSEKPEGTTLAEVYEGIFRYAKQKYPDYKGVCVMALKATIGGLASSDMKTSLLAAVGDKSPKNPVAMPGGKTVTELPFDGSALEKISLVDVKPRYAGDVLISAGFGIDLAVAQKAFPPEALATVTVRDARTSAEGVFLYNKGVVFKNLSWDNTEAFEEQLGRVAESGEFVAMHNLLSISRVRSALVGIAPVSAIRKEK